MAVSSGTVVVAERHSRLVGLESATGEPRWEQHVEDCWGTVVIAGDRCLYLSQAGVLHCFDLGTGWRWWSRPGLELRHHVSVSDDVIFLGGWRGYHPLIRVSVLEGRPLPFDGAASIGPGPLAEPLPVGGGGVLVAGADRPVLHLVASSGAVLAEWSLPEPMVFPDAGGGFGVGDDGRVTFLSGRRVVMALHPADVSGPQVLWRHGRDLRPIAPMLDGRMLWLVDESGIAVVDLESGAVIEVGHRAHGYVSAAVLADGEALFAFKDGTLATLDRAGGFAVWLRLPARIDRLTPGGDGLVHAIGKGWVFGVGKIEPASR
jgi:outer membrane protein assembly factor BamB